MEFLFYLNMFKFFANDQRKMIEKSREEYQKEYYKKEENWNEKKKEN